MLCSSRVVAMKFKECCHMGPINVETQRTLKEIFEEHHGEMPKTGFFSGCEMPSP